MDYKRAPIQRNAELAVQHKFGKHYCERLILEDGREAFYHAIRVDGQGHWQNTLIVPGLGAFTFLTQYATGDSGPTEDFNRVLDQVGPVVKRLRVAV